MKTAIASILVLASAVLAGRPMLRKPGLSANTARSIGNLVTENSPQLGKRHNAPVDSLTGNNTHPGVGYFEQPIDHNNPSLGTFKMRYYWSNQFWKGPGSPIVLFPPGEADASTYLNYYDMFNETLMYQSPAQLAYELGAAFLMVENRYYGESSPYDKLTTANLQYLTYEQAMHDLVNFAANVKLPFSHNSTASNVPWVLTGASYIGALAAFIAHKLPGTFWAYYASSAVLQQEESFWRANLAFQTYGPKNCTKDVAAVVDHIDQVLLHGSKSEKVAIKTTFGLQNLTDDVDFVSTLNADPNLWYSQRPNVVTAARHLDIDDIYRWCDAVEGLWDPVTRNYTKGALPGAQGVGMQKALSNWGSWWRNHKLPGSCSGSYGQSYPGLYSENSTYCFESVDPNDPFFTDLSVGNPWNRQLFWMQCNEPSEYVQGGTPKGLPTVYSRLITVDSYHQTCNMAFPPGPKGEKYGLRTEDEHNAYFGGWNIKDTKRLLYVNGERDAWKPATVAAPQRPGGPLQSTPEIPTWVIPGGFHASDFDLWDDGRHNADILRTALEVLAQLKTWVSEWPAYHGKIP